MNLQNFSIKTRFDMLTATFAIGLGIFAIVSFTTVETVKVNGPSYARIVRNKDLLADVLPPPAYLVETRMVALEIDGALRAGDRQRVASLLDRYKVLRSDFQASLDHWRKDLPEGPIRAALLNQAAPAGVEMLALMDRDFVPAAERGDAARTTALLNGEINIAYEKHRAGVEQVVSAGTQQSKELEQSVAAVLKAKLIVLGFVALVILAVVLLLAGMIANGVLRPIRNAVEAAHLLSAGDLTAHLDESGRDELAEFSRSLNQALHSMRDSLLSIQAATNAVSSASGELSAASQSISSGAQEQASSLEETAASLEEMTAAVKQNADSAQQAAQLAQGARDVAVDGGRVVRAAVDAMTEINASSRKIADIISAIDEIAFQTNLLALNAAVEAARAGEQGRGFAVVAGEVRNLAQRSASAAKEIKGLINDSVEKVESGSKLVNQSGDQLEEIVTSVKRVTDIVSEIAASSREQSTGIEQVSTAVTQMDAVTQENAAQTEELAGTAEALASQAQQMTALVRKFKLGEDGREEHHAPAPTGAPRARARVLPMPRRAASRSASPAATATGTHGGFETF